MINKYLNNLKIGDQNYPKHQLMSESKNINHKKMVNTNVDFSNTSKNINTSQTQTMGYVKPLRIHRIHALAILGVSHPRHSGCVNTSPPTI